MKISRIIFRLQRVSPVIVRIKKRDGTPTRILRSTHYYAWYRYIGKARRTRSKLASSAPSDQASAASEESGRALDDTCGGKRPVPGLTGTCTNKHE
jgi:hypothetical protein